MNKAKQKGLKNTELSNGKRNLSTSNKKEIDVDQKENTASIANR